MGRAERIDRVSPLLGRPGREAVLGYAPAPWILKQCLETGMVYLANPPAYAELESDFAYEHTFAAETAARRRAEPLRYAISAAIKAARARLMHRNKMLALVRREVLARQGAVQVLDIGCGWGSLLEQLFDALPEDARKRSVPHGLEISRSLAAISQRKFAALGGACVQGPAVAGLERMAEGSMDVISMASYLEHEIHPLEVLRLSRSRLKDGGVVVVKLPNYASWNRVLRGARWCGFRWPDHVNYFTPQTLAAMAQLSGFNVTMGRLDRQPFSDNMYALLHPA
jgi:2-polyprenyl-3-methyl-5-hydroxy-6-metoxy-1,4-benzoquinol methylase